MKALTSVLIAAAITFAFQVVPAGVSAQEGGSDTAYVFETLIGIPVTGVKDQHRSGTCWAFAGISFLEAEILRKTDKVTYLSEMFVVRYAYAEKAVKYVRHHGNANFGPGGQGHDVINVIAKYGIVPEEHYQGLEIGEEKHNHGEMDAVLNAFLDAVVKRRGGKLSPVWPEAYGAILDAYLGSVPDSFVVEGVEYDPLSYAASLGIVADDYIELTSYRSYPFYETVNLEIPDNWSGDLYYNLPLDEFMEVIDHALENGYSICWDGDVSDRGFSHRDALAILPEKDLESLDGTERERWEKLTEEEKTKELYSFKTPGTEKKVDQAMRQEHFDNYSSTDDHLMHLCGIVEDQHGTRYYVTKNSWDDDSNSNGGHLNMSESYVKLNTIAIMVHKDALPVKIAKKLGL